MIKPTCFILCALCFLTASAQIQLKKNDSFEKTTISNVTTEMDFMGQKMTNRNKTTMHDITTVTAVDKDNYTLSTTILRMIMELNANGMDFKIDTDEKDNELTKQYKAEIEKAEVIVIDKKGKMVSADFGGSEKVEMDKLIDGINQMVLTPAQTAAHQKVGAVWTEKNSNAAGYDFTHTYKTVGNNGKIITIEVVSEGTIKTDVEVEDGQQATVQLSGSMKGVNSYSVATGFLDSTDMKSDFKGKMSMSGMDIPFALTSASKTTVVKK